MAPWESNSMTGSGRSKSMEPRRWRFFQQARQFIHPFEFRQPAERIAPVFADRR
jgi:hypothetical protein